MDNHHVKAALEAILFAAGAPVPAQRIADALDTGIETIKEQAQRLAEEYSAADRGLAVIRLEDSFQICNKKRIRRIYSPCNGSAPQYTAFAGSA